jgi:hypothetical protein
MDKAQKLNRHGQSISETVQEHSISLELHKHAKAAGSVKFSLEHP